MSLCHYLHHQKQFQHFHPCGRAGWSHILLVSHTTMHRTQGNIIHAAQNLVSAYISLVQWCQITAQRSTWWQMSRDQQWQTDITSPLISSVSSRSSDSKSHLVHRLRTTSVLMAWNAAHKEYNNTALYHSMAWNTAHKTTQYCTASLHGLKHSTQNNIILYCSTPQPETQHTKQHNTVLYQSTAWNTAHKTIQYCITS